MTGLASSGGKQTFDLPVRIFANYVRFGPKSGRIDTVTVESANDVVDGSHPPASIVPWL